MADKPTRDADPITRSELVEAMHALATSLKPQGPLEQAGLTPERIAAIRGLPAPQKYREIPWRSETGATAIAVVVESKTHKEGRITQLKNYTHPPEAYLSEALGGHLPKDFPMWKDGRTHEITEGKEPAFGDLAPLFLQWRYERYYQADLRQYIGKGIGPHCATNDGLAAKWLESRVGSTAEA